MEQSNHLGVPNIATENYYRHFNQARHDWIHASPKASFGGRFTWYEKNIPYCEKLEQNWEALVEHGITAYRTQVIPADIYVMKDTSDYAHPNNLQFLKTDYILRKDHGEHTGLLFEPRGRDGKSGPLFAYAVSHPLVAYRDGIMPIVDRNFDAENLDGTRDKFRVIIGRRAELPQLYLKMLFKHMQGMLPEPQEFNYEATPLAGVIQNLGYYLAGRRLNLAKNQES